MSLEIRNNSVAFQTIATSAGNSLCSKLVGRFVSCVSAIVSGSYLLGLFRKYRVEDHLTEHCDFMFLFQSSRIVDQVKKLAGRKPAGPLSAGTTENTGVWKWRIRITFGEITIGISVFLIFLTLIYSVLHWKFSGSADDNLTVKASWITIPFVWILVTVIGIQLKSLGLLSGKSGHIQANAVLYSPVKKARILVSILLSAAKYRLHRFIFSGNAEVEGGDRKHYFNSSSGKGE